MSEFTIGVEEEYQIVDAETLELRPRGEKVLAAAGRRLGDRVQHELNLSQIEVETGVCKTLDEVRRELQRLRGELTAAARQVGCLVAATGTHPFTGWEEQGITPKPRYLELAEEYQVVAWQQLICGCHVHVGIDDPEIAVQVVDRSRPWLPVVLALSANSPFWRGIDTGFASYRIQMWERWPLSGTPDVFGSRPAYDALVEDLTCTGAVPDPTKLYWDVRPSARYPTVEFRIADICPRLDETVMLAGLCRSLARTCAAQAEEDEAVVAPRPEMIRAARWRASRYGLDRDLIDLEVCESVPAPALVDRLLAWLRPDLEEHGEWEEVSALVRRQVEAGNGARRQRHVFEGTGSVRAVIRHILEETVADC